MKSPAGDLLVVGYDLTARTEVHIGDRPMEQWWATGYNGDRTVVCYLCWVGIDADAGTQVALVPRGRIGGRNRPHFAHPPGSGVHNSGTARETMWHLATKYRLARWAASKPNVAQAVAERWTPDRTRRADVDVVLNDGTRLALEVQSRAITDQRWAERHRDYTCNDIRDVWFMAADAELPHLLIRSGVQVLRVHGDKIGVLLGRPHERTGQWWTSDLDKFALHQPPCPGDTVESMRFDLEDLDLDRDGVRVPGAVTHRLTSSRLRIERDAIAARHHAEVLQVRALGAAKRLSASQVPVVDRPPPSARQRRILELRASVAERAPATEAPAHVSSDARPQPGNDRPVTEKSASWVPTPAFTADLACVHCGGSMGVLTSWPDYMGVPRSVHPLQCTVCTRLSGAACPCSDCQTPNDRSGS